VEILRRAFQETFKDPAFVADTDKSKLDVEPITGQDLERIIAGFFKIDKVLMARLKDVLK
jgi:hypothetical protein